MNFDDFASMQINGQEITELRIDDVLVWKKNTISNDLMLSFTGSNFSIDSVSEGLTGQDIVIDWGDGATTNYTGVGDLNHTYSTSGDYSIKISRVTSLGDYCFKSCIGLTSITIPNSVTSLGNDCFRGCTGLTSIEIPKSVINIGSSCFSHCSGLTSVVIPEGVINLGDSCFAYCIGLTNIVIPNNVTSLGAYCFRHCSNLTSIEIPEGVTNIGTDCFRECSSLTSIEIPEGVTNIVGRCFGGCSSLTNITIPEGVTNLGADCFRGCYSLTSIEIPKSVINIGSSCFSHCSGLTSLICNWESNPHSYNSDWILYTNSSLKFSIPYGTTSIYTDAGYPLDKLEEREEPTLTISTENEIISKYGDGSSGEEIGANIINTSTLLTITLTGVDNSDKDIIIKENGTQIDTVQTNSRGFAKYYYKSKGDGEIEFTAECGDLISNSCHIIDAKYYASNETISSVPTYNNDRTLFASDYTLSEGDKVHFRFKSIPNRCIYGFGSTAGSDFVFEKTGTTLKYWGNVLSNGSYDNPNFMPSTEYDIVMEFTKYNASTYRMKLYKGDTYVDYWTCGNSIKKVRVDKFFNDDFEIEVFVL